MTRLFEELDHSDTALGELSLRRRRHVGLDTDVYEVKLDDHFLMSSLFTASEEALGRLGVHHALQSRGSAESPAMDDRLVDLVVGGLGLGYTAATVLENPAVGSLLVVEHLEPVIGWHRRGLLPVSDRLTGDTRCRFVSADFFSRAASYTGFDPALAGRTFDAVLVDIDHSPEALLDPANDSFYRIQGLQQMRRHLRPGGVFGLWSNDPPDDTFRRRMAAAFAVEWAEPVTFHNPLQDTEATQTVYFGVSDAG